MPLRPLRAIFCFCLVLGAVAFAYWPGLSGDFVFDDVANIGENKRLQISSLGVTELRGAFLSGNAGPLGRPVSMLSFALNYYFSGLDPFLFKITNLIIHLINVVLVAILAQLLIRSLSAPEDTKQIRFNFWAGWGVALLWGIHPLNLTSVLYVVQRMTSLSTLFGLLALILYMRIRSRNQLVGARKRDIVEWALLIVSLALSAFSKESGLLFAALLLWLEYLIFDFRGRVGPMHAGAWDVKRIISWAIVASAAFFSVLVLPHLIQPGAFSGRDFSLVERLMTEARGIFYYLRLFCYPRTSELSLYHDDFLISTSLLTPLTTGLSIVAIIGLTALSFRFRKSHPMLLFGWGWFLISHSMESSFFALELIHEHRNYFATIGPLIAVSLMMKEGWKYRQAYCLVGAALFFCLCGYVTWARAVEWSNPVDHAAIEASNKPNSDRANYQLARVYLRLLDQTKDQKYIELAEDSFQKAMHSYKAGNGAYFGMIHLAYYLGRDPNPRLIADLESRLRTLPFYTNNLGFLSAFVTCQMEKYCKMPDMDAISIMVAALENPHIYPVARAEINKLMAQYFINRFGDFSKGVEFINDAITERDDVSTRIMLAQAYRLQGKLEEARTQLTKAEAMDFLDVNKISIARERAAQIDKTHLK
ncbi:tetratricopeptide repeat protein [Variovorax paradoxus]|uniref:tetratricopeptide repeat protein n=1 Tax=Variovorax paradoxus TaxID=34073 RepID=UPI00286C7063|nr:hypothetical protein [Variovorax paradoxus]